MYSSYYPIGTAGHRASSSYSYYPNYESGYPAGYSLPAPPPPPPPQYYQPPGYYNQQQAAPVGGISAVLDYDTSEMASFICWCVFGILNQNRTPSKDLEAGLVSILNATRLPKSTILISLEYVNQRYSAAPTATLSDVDLFMKLVVSLVLANKFNDDNTFTNKSWSGASGVALDALNKAEAEWLREVKWKLNVVSCRASFETLDECWTTWLKRNSSAKSRASPYVPASPARDSGRFSAPSSPLYEASSYGYSSPAKPMYNEWYTPVMMPHNYNMAGYVPVAPPSIWTYPPSAYQPFRNDAVYYNSAPYYNIAV